MASPNTRGVCRDEHLDSLSVQWSNNPSLAFRRLIILFLMFAAAYGTTVKWPGHVLLHLIVFSAGIQLTVGFLSEVAHGSFTPFNSWYRFSGNLGPNGEGQLCAVFALTSIAAIHSADRYKFLFRFGALYGITFLLLTQSLTSLAGFLAGITVYLFFRFSTGGRLRFVYLGVMVALIIGLLGLAYGFSIDPVAKASGRDPEGMTELTGRIPLWVECMSYIKERPLLGYGYEGVWRPDNTGDIEAATGWLAGSAHSTYIDLWLALGIVGLVLHTSILLLLLRRAAKIYRATKAPEFAAAAALSVQYLVFGGLESTSLIRFSSILFFSYCLFLMVALADISGSIPIHRKRRRTRPVTRSQGAFGDG